VDFVNQLVVLDRAVALSRVGGDVELLKEMAQLFLEEFQGQIQAVRDAVASQDPKAIERSAHCLKGSIGSFGAVAAHRAALALEMLGRKADLAPVGPALSELEHALTHLKPELEKLAQETL